MQRRNRRPDRLTRKSKDSRRLLLEALEDRALLAAFNYADFSNPSGLALVGDAAITSSRLRLTPAAGSMEGAAWRSAEKQFLASGFTTSFRFQLADNFDSPGGSDGFVFAIQNSSTSFVGGGGGGLAYSGLPKSVVVEFDTYQNLNFNDPSQSHISVHTNGLGANDVLESYSLGSYSTSSIMDDAAIHSVKIDYQPGTLSIYLDNMTTPVLSVAIDLADRLGLTDGQAWVGFTASTGGGWQTHDILNWEFNSATPPATMVSIGNASQVEGTSGSSALSFTIARSGDLSGQATVDWSTVDGTATAASGDYTAASGQVIFAPLEATQSITVNVNGDLSLENHETISVKLTNASGATITDGTGTGTILNDEVAFSISDAAAVEGSTQIVHLGNFTWNTGLIDSPYSIIYGPDGNVYVSSNGANAIYRFNGTTGSPFPAAGKSGAEFVSPGEGGLQLARSIAFGPDGHLYVVSEMTDAVLRFDGQTGAPLGAVVASGVGGLSRPRGLLFHTDGFLYVTSVSTSDTPSAGTDSILRFNATNGAPAGLSGAAGDAVFVKTGLGGLDNPSVIVFHNGDFYVSSTNPSTSNSVLRYRTDGTFRDAFVPTGSGGLAGPVDLVFRDGYLYVSSWTNNKILRYHGSTGAFVDTVVDAGGLAKPLGFLFEPSGNFLVSSGDSDEIRRYGVGSQAAATIRLNNSSAEPVSVFFETANGTALAGQDYTARTGTVTFAPGEIYKTILVSTLDDSELEGLQNFTIRLSNPSGHSQIIDDEATVSIQDNEFAPTKFYVVDSADKTFEYAADGSATENYGLKAGNINPRGVASHIAGDRVWIIDNNKTVYIYDPSGALIGSWAAGGLAGTASLQGIATNGTDIWLLDSKQDRIYRYSGAANRLTGSQNPISSFALNKGNVAPSDMVTDGKHIWVVQDSSVDTVFKYSLTGTLAGSWTIATPNTLASVGITLDPVKPDHLWIVDSYLERVFQYNSAVLRTGGSASADDSFPLAPGNYDAQGIADPPVAVGETSEAASSITVDSAAFARPWPAESAPTLLKHSGQGKSDSRSAARRIDTAMAQWSDKLVIQRQSVSRRQPTASIPSGTFIPVEIEKQLDDQLEQAVEALFDDERGRDWRTNGKAFQ